MNIRKGLILIACAFTSAALFFSILPGCSQSSSKTSDAVSKVSSSLSSSESSHALSDKACVTEYNASDFYSIKKAVTKTFYVNTANAYKSCSFKDKYDFDGDGTDDDIAVDFKSSESSASAETTVTVGSSQQKLNILGLAGVYAVKLDKSSTENTLAVVEYSTDIIIITHFYRYKDGKLIKLGEFSGAFEADPSRQVFNKEYNEEILVDGTGNLVPRYSLMKFVSPEIFLNVYQLSGGSFNKVLADPNSALCDEYTLSLNVRPYFEQGNYNLQNYIPKCNANDITKLSTGDKIKILSVSTKQSNQEFAVVRLADGRQGILYFYLSP